MSCDKKKVNLSCSREVIAGSGGSQYPPGTKALALMFSDNAAAAASPVLAALAAAAVVLGGVDDACCGLAAVEA